MQLSATSSACWPFATYPDSFLEPFPSVCGGAHLPLTTLCLAPPCLAYVEMVNCLSDTFAGRAAGDFDFLNATPWACTPWYLRKPPPQDVPKNAPFCTKRIPGRYQKENPKCTENPPIDVAKIDPYKSYMHHQKHPFYLVVEPCGSHAPTWLQTHTPHTLLLHPIAEACRSQTPSQPCVHVHPLNMPVKHPDPDGNLPPVPAAVPLQHAFKEQCEAKH